MIAKRLLGVLRQYPNPEVALYVAEILSESTVWLSTYYGGHRHESDEDKFFRNRGIYTGRGRLLFEARDRENIRIELTSVLTGNTERSMMLGLIYPPMFYAEHSRLEIIVPWLAKVVNFWIKNEPTPNPLDPGPSRLWYKDLRDLIEYTGIIVDWVHAERVNIMPLAPQQAVFRAIRWHNEFGRREAERLAKLPPPNSPVVFSVDGYNVHELTTREALEHEGACQQHCVGTYWSDVAQKRARIFSVRRIADGKVRATIELQPYAVENSWVVNQVQGPKNTPMLNAEVRNVLLKFVNHFSAQSTYGWAWYKHAIASMFPSYTDFLEFMNMRNRPPISSGLYPVVV